MKNIAVILSGGTGTRFGEKISKQFTKLAGKTVIEYTIEAFQKNENIDKILIVGNTKYNFILEEILLKNNYTNIQIIAGGKTRQESSYSALLSLEGKIHDNDNILFHDAVRPFISQNIINNTISLLKKYNSVDVCINVPDTIVEIKDNILTHIPNRNNLKRGQTPQGFKYGLIKKAHEKAIKDNFSKVTDDCGLVLNYFPNEKIGIVDGEEKNMKITYPLDIHIANYIIQIGEYIKDMKINFNKLKNKVHIIFGHTSGIGKKIFDELNNKNIKVYGFSYSSGCDISNEKDIIKSLEYVYKKEGKIDSIIITAGILKKEKLETSSIADIVKQIQVNYIGTVLISKLSIPYLKETKGNLLLFGSSSYSKGRAFYSIYSSTKSALINFTQALAEELLPINIKVNIINPERTLTRMRIENFGKENEKTLLDAKKVGKVAINILNKNITGQIIDIRVKDFN